MTLFYFLQYEYPCICATILEASSQAHLLQFVLFHYVFSSTAVIFLIKKRHQKLQILGETGETHFTQSLPLNTVIKCEQKAWNTYLRTLKSK